MKKQHMSEEFSINSLSVDVYFSLLDHITEPEDRKSFRLVNKCFFRVESVHRRSIKILRREYVTTLIRRYPFLECLDLSDCPVFPDEILMGCSGMMSNLRRVDFSKANGIGWRGLEALVGSCPKLESVDFSHCVGVGDREAAAVSMAKGLKEVKFDKCLELTDVGLAKVAVRCENLESLGLKWCLEVSDIGIELLAKKCRKLKILDISYLKVTNKSLSSITSLENLEALLMVGCSHIDDDGLRYFGSMNISLRILDVSRCDNVTSSGLIPIIGRHKYIENLNFGDCYPELAPQFLSEMSILNSTINTLKLDGFQTSATSLKAISNNCNNLKEISLSKCHGVNDEGVRSLVSNCVGLITIDLTCCKFITDEALYSISKNCKKLECLRVESCSLLSDRGIGQIFTSCTELKEIDLTDCSINDSAFQSLSKRSKLMILKLGLCSSITDDGLAHIGSNCSDLIILDLYRSARVSDEGLASIAAGCKKLKELNLCYCNDITDQGIQHLSSLKELSVLELRGLHNVSGLGITALSTGCNKLTKIDMKRCYSVDDVAVSSLVAYCHNIRQINISYCAVTLVGLWKLLGSLRCLQDVDLVHLTKVSVEGFELGLRASCGKLKKLKLSQGLMDLLSPQLLHMLHARGCRFRCVNKPFSLGQ